MKVSQKAARSNTTIAALDVPFECTECVSSIMPSTELYHAEICGSESDVEALEQLGVEDVARSMDLVMAAESTGGESVNTGLT